MDRPKRTTDMDLIEILNSPDIIYKDGKGGDDLSEWYINIKRACGEDPYVLSFISYKLLNTIDEDTTCIVAHGYGGMAFASNISLISEMNGNPIKFSMIRDTKQNHGDYGMFDYHDLVEGDKVSIVDDTLASGKSLEDMIKTVKETGAEILGCYTVAKRAIKEVKFITADGLEVPVYYQIDTETAARQLNL